MQFEGLQNAEAHEADRLPQVFHPRSPLLNYSREAPINTFNKKAAKVNLDVAFVSVATSRINGVLNNVEFSTIIK